MSGSYDYLSNTGECNVLVSPDTPITGSFKLYLVLVEDGLVYGGLHHGSVMRDMYPSSSGLNVYLSSGSPVSENFSFAVPSPFVFDNCRLVAFVQNTATKGILNAAVVDISSISPINIPNLTVIGSEMHVIEDDGDDKLNPGESAYFAVTLENACGWLDAENVHATLNCSNPYVSILDGEADYDLIVACDFIENTNDMFHISVAPDAPLIGDIEFELTLQANQDTEAPYVSTRSVIYSMNLFQLNFPVAFSQPVADGNAVVDLDGDGSLEIVVGGVDSLLHVLTLGGTELAGFPFHAGNKLYGSPAVADVDNDGDLEVVFVCRDGGIYVVQHDGSGGAITFAASYLLGTPALTDFDDDGDLEIVAAGWGYDLLAVHHDGTALAGFPKIITSERMSTAVALADINGDGVDDILVGTWSDKLHVFDHTGVELAGFPVNIGDDIKAPPTVTDLDGDNQLEILVAQDEGQVSAISTTGQILWTHSEATAGIRTTPSVADFDGDGQREVIFTANDGFLTITDHTGADLPGWPIYLGAASYSSPVVADIDGDGIPEIFMGSNGQEVHAYHVDGSSLENFPVLVSGEAIGTPTIADLDQDGNLEVVIGTNSGLTVIDIKDLGSNAQMWYTDRGDYHRTGAFLYGYVLSAEPGKQVPETLSLDQNYPNPFNPSTTIGFGVPTAGHVNLTIFDLKGQEIASLVSETLEAGTYTVVWNGLDHASRPLETGVYFARVRSGGAEQVIKMMLLK